MIQDSFVIALEQLPKLREGAAFRAWLLRIVVHQAHRRYRKRRMLARLGFVTHDEVDILCSQTRDDSDAEAEAELRRSTRCSCACRNERFAWVLRHVEGYQLEEVATPATARWPRPSAGSRKPMNACEPRCGSRRAAHDRAGLSAASLPVGELLEPRTAHRAKPCCGPRSGRPAGIQAAARAPCRWPCPPPWMGRAIRPSARPSVAAIASRRRATRLASLARPGARVDRSRLPAVGAGVAAAADSCPAVVVRSPQRRRRARRRTPGPSPCAMVNRTHESGVGAPRGSPCGRLADHAWPGPELTSSRLVQKTRLRLPSTRHGRVLGHARRPTAVDGGGRRGAVEVVGTAFRVRAHASSSRSRCAAAWCTCAAKTSRPAPAPDRRPDPRHHAKPTATAHRLPTGSRAATGARTADRRKPRASPHSAAGPAAPPAQEAPAGQTDWRAEFAGGRYERRIAPSARRACAARPREASLNKLLALADVARLSSHPSDAVSPLTRIMDSFSASPQAAAAAFTLGRLFLDQLRAPAQAARAFERAIAMHPPHAFLEDCHARLVHAFLRANQREKAAHAVARYRALFPTGDHLGELQERVAP